jgi:hypothetical protein
LILVITDFVIGQAFRLSLLPRIVVYTTGHLPVTQPGARLWSRRLVVKLALADLQRTGNTVGTIYAFSTAGSIVGTFLTGFWLISWLGTRSIVWIVAGVLLITGLAVGEFHRSRGLGRMAAGLLAPVLAFATFAFVRVGWSAGKYRAPCEVESNYYCIQINETFENGRPARALMLDRLIHSFVVLDDPTALGYGYERAYADLTQMQLSGRQQIHTLFIGGGGYSFPRYIEATYPGAAVDVIEIDPEVTKVAHNQLGLGNKTRIRSFNQDARTFLMEWPDRQQYDVVFGDAFNDLSIPYHLTTCGVQPHRPATDEARRDLPRKRHRQVRGRRVSQGICERPAGGLRARLPVWPRQRVPALRSQHVRPDGQPPAAEPCRLRGDHIH